MHSIVKTAKKYVEKGYSVIPITKDKNPSIQSWGQYMYTPISLSIVEDVFGPAWGIALLMGGKNHLTAIDVDLKYDLTNTLWNRLQEEIGEELLSKMWINKTMNGGYHLVFSCSKTEGNQKLAARYTTDIEKIETFQQELDKGSLAEVALKAGYSDTTRVLIETRGHGGYILIAPSPGYQTISGKIQSITTEEYDFVLDTCRKFNTYIKPTKNYSIDKFKKDSGSASDILASFNKTADVVSILEGYGWTQVGQDGTRIKLKRPGRSMSKDSGWFDIENRIFWVFSTSTSFKVCEGYSAVDVILTLKNDSDDSYTISSLIKELTDET